MAILPMTYPSENAVQQDTMFEDVASFNESYTEDPTFEQDVEFPEEAVGHLPHELEDAPDAAVGHSPDAAVEAEPSSHTALSVDDFAGLEERVLKAVTLVRSERQSRITAEARAVAAESQLHQLEAQLQSQAPALERLAQLDQLQQENASLRTEREQVRQRVERLLGQLDALEL